MSIIQARQRIIDIVNQTDDIHKLNNVLTQLERCKLKSIIDIILSRKLNTNNVGNISNKIIDSFIETNTDSRILIQTLNELTDKNGFWCGENLFINSDSGNIYNVLNNYFDYKTSKAVAFNVRGKLGLGPDQGPGELLLLLTGRNMKLASKGDFVVNDKTIEMKTTGVSPKGKKSGGRLYSATHDYGSISSTRKTLAQYLIESGVPSDILAQYGWPNNQYSEFRGGFNLNNSGISNMSQVFKMYLDQEKTQKFIYLMLSNFYPNLELIDITAFMKNVPLPNGGIDVNKFIEELLISGFSYYQACENFDRLLLFNGESGNYLSIKDLLTFRKFYQNKKILLSSDINWFDDRGRGTAQVIIN